MKKAAAILILLSFVIPSCTDDQDDVDRYANELETEQPALIEIDTENEATPPPVETNTIEEPTAAGGMFQGEGTNLIASDDHGLPERDDLAPIAAYCWANPGRCIGKGDPDAPVIAVEISDYGCGHCRNFNLETSDLVDALYVESGDVYWLVLPYALIAQRTPAPASALCAAEQGMFFEYHRRLFEIFDDRDAGTFDGLFRAAGEIGLNMSEFKACMESERYYPVVQQNVAVASSLGVNATPSFYIGEQSFKGNVPIEFLRQKIDSELEAKG